MILWLVAGMFIGGFIGFVAAAMMAAASRADEIRRIEARHRKSTRVPGEFEWYKKG